MVKEPWHPNRGSHRENLLLQRKLLASIKRYLCNVYIFKIKLPFYVTFDDRLILSYTVSSRETNLGVLWSWKTLIRSLFPASPLLLTPPNVSVLKSCCRACAFWPKVPVITAPCNVHIHPGHSPSFLLRVLLVVVNLVSHPVLHSIYLLFC